MSGWLAIVGLGPGDDRLVTPEVTESLAQASDVVGYIPYVARIAPRVGLALHPSDNRVELDRARAALEMTADGKRVVVVSSGDPGVFAMASAVFEALEGREDWQALDIRVLPGITAMLAAAAAAGAPLGHDFACINLSDNLKPWEVIETRLPTLPAPTSRWPSTTRGPPAARKGSSRHWQPCVRNAGRIVWSPSPARSARPTSASRP
jgi:precorrin-3B C17-methyltransferase